MQNMGLISGEEFAGIDLLGIGVTVARLTLDQLVMVQIHDPQLPKKYPSNDAVIRTFSTVG
jgi:hypothetical protein